jgi:hypothetical protein
MRLLITIFILVLNNLALAQTDSTQIKLENYKKWFDSGLIDKDEYNKLKNQVLKISTTITQKDTLTIKDSNYKIKSGAIFSTFCIGGLIYSKIYLTNSINSTPYDKNYSKNIESINQDYKVLRAASVGLGILGLGLIAYGLKLKTEYYDQKTSVSIDIPNLTIALRF